VDIHVLAIIDTIILVLLVLITIILVFAAVGRGRL
jgi:hypothetical protein